MANSGARKSNCEAGRHEEAKNGVLESLLVTLVVGWSQAAEASSQPRHRDVQRVDAVSLKDVLKKLHDNSPFRRGPTHILRDSTLSSTNAEAHLNSVNTGGSQDIDVESYYGPPPAMEFAQELVETSLSMRRDSRSDISESAKEMIMNIQKRFASQQDERMLHSLTPESSLLSGEDEDCVSASPRPCGQIFDSQCSLFRSDEEITSDEEAIGSVRGSQSLEGGKMGLLVAEVEGEESHAFYKSTEALKKAKIAGIYKSTDEEFSGSSADEGIPSLPTFTFFSNGETASKNLLAKSRHQITMHQIQPKVLISTTLLMTINESFEASLVDLPDSLSPIYRKIVVCEEAGPSAAEAAEVWSCCGFVSSPGLVFSDIDCMSRGTSASNYTVTRYFSLPIVHKFLKNSVMWLSCGFEHCALATADGSVFTWGYGGSGCLGHGDTNSHTVPRKVSSLPPVTYLECGSYHNAAITDKGELYTWGRADVHQLGIPPKRLLRDDIGYAAFTPTRVEEFVSRGKCIKGLACGEAHTLVLDLEGRVYAFGWAEDGQLGLPQSLLKDGQHSVELTDIPSLRKQKVVKVAAGSLFSACVTEGGKVYVWGNGEHGQLGLGHSIKRTELPALQTQLGVQEVIDIVCGESWVIALEKSGKAYGWGQGTAGPFKGKNFSPGMDLVCFFPRLLTTVDTAFHIVVARRKPPPKPQPIGFIQALSAKLKLLTEREIDYESEDSVNE